MTTKKEGKQANESEPRTVISSLIYRYMYPVVSSQPYYIWYRRYVYIRSVSFNIRWKAQAKKPDALIISFLGRIVPPPPTHLPESCKGAPKNVNQY